jgi:hypothetical protein
MIGFELSLVKILSLASSVLTIGFVLGWFVALFFVRETERSHQPPDEER